MKKILFVNNNMKVGGVQKSLYNLLWALDGRYDITLLLFSKTGPYLEQLPPNVRVEECRSLFRLLGISQGECRGFDKLIRGGLVLLCRLFGRKNAMRLVLNSQKPLPEQYDCAISFLQNGNVRNFYGGVQEFVLKKVTAKKKVAFLHCDYENCGANHPTNNDLLGAFDAVAACSDGCRRAAEKVLPDIQNRCVTVRNCHRLEEIAGLAEVDPMVYAKEPTNVVMVSRLSHEKGIERALEAMAFAAAEGHTMQLHIVGSGPMEEMLRQKAAELDMAGCVHFYGEQANPYRYMKNADLFLLTSFHEAAPMVLEEARCLGLPVLTVRTTSSEEMVTAQNAGWVCENNQQALNESLTQILTNKDELEKQKRKLQSIKMDNNQALTQFVSLVEG